MTHSRNKIVFGLFALSGLSGLVYESLWVRVLSLGVGSTSAALSIVLAIFFTGLAAGSFLGGKVLARWPNPLRTYAILEGFVGLFGLLIIYPLVHFQGLLSSFPAALLALPAGVIGLKFALVFVLLALPTLAMGATFPLLTSYLVFSKDGKSDSSDSSLETLYGINTLGAVLGAMSTSFLLLPFLGVRKANLFAACLNLLICGVAFFLARKADVAKHAASSISLEDAARDRGSASKWALALGALLGFSSIGAEIIWNKYLGIFFGTNIYGLGLILSLYLTGIGLGSFLGAPLARRFPKRNELFAGLVLFALFATFVASRLLNVAPVAANTLAHYLSPHVSLLAIKCILTAAILFLPTLAFGAIFPLMIRVAAGEGAAGQARLPKMASLGYALNTLGAVTASCFIGIYVVPKWGSAVAIRLCFLVLGVGVLGFIARAPGWSLSQRRRWTGVGLVTLAICVALGTVDFRNIIKSAYVQNIDPATPLSEVVRFFANDFEEFKLIVEGETAVTSLSHDPQDGTDYRKYLRLKSNGLNESVYQIDDLQALPKYEALLGFLPYLFVRSPHSAFVVGYGGGYTADFLSRINLQKVDVVELEPGILQAADVVYNGENPILKRKNLNLRIEDARYVLASDRRARYDIIVSQPSHSWLSGVANLFTRDFFEIVRGRLTEKGVFSQWLNLYNIDEESLKSILATFYSVFPHGSVFTDFGDSQMIMIGSMQPLVLNMQKLRLLTQNDILRKQLQFVPFESPYDFLTNFSLGMTRVRELAKNSPMNTDDNAFAEVHQSALFYQKSQSEIDAQHFLRRSYAADFTDILEAQDAKDPEFLLALAKAFHRNRKIDKLFAVTRRLESIGNPPKGPNQALLHVLVLSERHGSALKLARDILAAKQGNKEIFALYARSLIETHRYEELLKAAQGHASLRNGEFDCYEAYARLKSQAGWERSAQAQSVIRYEDRWKRDCGYFHDKLRGELEFARGNIPYALSYLDAYVQSYASDVNALHALSEAYGQTPGQEPNRDYYRDLADREVARLAQLADFYQQYDLTEDVTASRERAAR